MNRIIVGYDGSSVSREAALVAAGLAREAHAELVVAFIAEPQRLSQPEDARVQSELLDGEEERGGVLLHTMRSVCACDVRTEIVRGDPEDELVRLSQSAGLLVIGRRRRGALRRALLGSIADAVEQRAACPVLVVREKPAGTAQLQPAL